MELSNFEKMKSFLEYTKNKYAQFLAASAMKQQLEDNWIKIPHYMKLDLFEYLVNVI